MATLMLGDCIERMAEIADGSVDAIVTDPPYGLKFMGKAWDHGVPGVEFWSAMLRVLKPGGYLLAFGGTRTFHRQVCAIEDGGFKLVDTLMWMYGQGFPKGKGQLKPGYEPITLARKPGGKVLPLGIDATRIGWNGPKDAAAAAAAAVGFANSRANGTSAQSQSIGKESRDGINRYEPDKMVGRWPANVILSHSPECECVGTRRVKGANQGGYPENWNDGSASYGGGLKAKAVAINRADPDGLETVESWQCVDGCPVAELDRQSGQSKSPPVGSMGGGSKSRKVFGFIAGVPNENGYGDSGGASRFFYCAKASRRDRNEGCEGMPESVQQTVAMGDRKHGTLPYTNDLREMKPVPRANHHPTVKPTELMRWLIRLVAKPGETILDPFAGSGSTLKSAVLEGVNAIGIERDESYLKIAKARILAAETAKAAS